MTYPFRPSGTNQTVAYTGTAGASSAVGSSIFTVALTSTTDCFFEFGVDPTATTSSTFLPALTPMFWGISPGEKVSVIQLSSGGNLYITEVTS